MRGWQLKGEIRREEERERREGETYLYASQDLGDVGAMLCRYMEKQLRSSVEPQGTEHSPGMAW